MTVAANESVARKVREIARSFGLALLHDPFGMLVVDDTEDVLCIPYVTPLAFRRQYEPLRHLPSKLIIHVKTPDPFIPDIEARVVAEQVIKVTPRTLLIEATADNSWPESVDAFGKLVADHLGGVAEMHKVFREATKTGFSDDDARRIVLSGVTGVQFAGAADQVAVWRFVFSNEWGHSELEKHTDLLEEFQVALRSMGEPFASLIDGDRNTTAQAVWTVKMLSQHLTDPLEFLPNVSAEFFGAQSWPLEEVCSLADGVADADPDLARRQVSEMESALSPEALELIARKLALLDSTRAVKAVLSEKMSSALSELSLRYLLSELPSRPALLSHKLLPGLLSEARSATSGGMSIFDSFIEARPRISDLLSLLVDVADMMSCLDANRVKVEALEKETAALKSPKPIVDVYCGSMLYRTDLLGSRVQRLVQDVGQTALVTEPLASDLQRRTAERTGAVIAESCDLLERLNRVYAHVVQAHYPTWAKKGTDVDLVRDFMPRTVVPHSHGKPCAYVLVFDGMRWDAWKEYVEPEARRHFDVACSPTLAILPSSTGHSRRALFSGKMPEQFRMNDAEDSLLAAAWTDGPASLSTTKDTNPEIALRMHGGGAEVIVFRFTDEILHTFNRDLAYLYDDHVKKIVERDVRQVLEAIPKEAIVFVSSDHGFVELGTRYTTVPMDCSFNPAVGDDIKWRHAMLVNAFAGTGNTVTFRPEEIRLSAVESGYVKGSGTVTKNLQQIVLAAGCSHLKRQGKGGPVPQFWHGGVSLQEMVVPCAVLTPKASTDVAKVEILGIDGFDRTYAEGGTGEVAVSLLFRGPARTERVEICFDPELIAGRSVVLKNGEAQTTSFPFTTVLPEGVTEHIHSLKLRIRLAGKSQTRLPQPRPCKLHVVKDREKIGRQTSQTLDDMFGKS